MKKPSFAVVGCGRLGTALGKHLLNAGYPLAGLTSKSLSSAKHTAEIIGTNKYSEVPRDITRSADVVFITTPDGIIGDACKTLAENDGFKNGAVVLHCSGAHPSTILSSAEKSGAFIGSMHPLQSFASKDIEGNPFQGITVSVEGTDNAVTIAEKMAVDLGATCLTIPTEAKTLYHAAAVTACNYLVTLFDLAFKLIEKAGISSDQAFKVLKPLIDGTISNIEKVGIPEALTGPIARGDTETVQRHMTAIISQTPGLLPLYKTLGFYTVDIAAAKGTLTEFAVQELRKILKITV